MSTSCPPSVPELVGREAEQALLLEALRRLGPGQGGVILISGEPGIGKSALLRWAAGQAAVLELPLFWGFAWEAGGAPPYWPWTQCLRSLLAGRDLPSGLFTQPLARLLPELADGEPAPASELQPDQARFQLFEAVRSLLARVAAEQPFVLALEDLHAGDPESLLLLQHVCQHAPQLGLLILGSFRDLAVRLPRQSALWRCAREARIVPLRGLDEEPVQSLLERFAGRRASGERLQQLLAATEGNPLYLTELLALQGESLLGTGDLPTLPGNLRLVIRQHLKTLPAATFDALAAAAVLGRDFEPAALAGLLGRELAGIEAELKPAEDAGLLRSGAGPARRFAHQFHREVLYAGLSGEERQRLHLRRAHGLRQAIQAGATESWAELASHYLAAGDGWRREAVAAWRSAARRAADRLAFTEAASLCQQALEAFGAGPGAEPIERCGLLLQAADVTLRAGDIEAGHRLCAEAFRIAAALEDSTLMARAALVYGSAFTIGRVDPELLRLLRESLLALDHDSGQGGAEAGTLVLRARLQARLAAALQPAENPAEPIAMARDAVESARGSGDRRGLFETLTSAVSALMDFAPATERVRYNEEYARLAEHFEDIPALFRAQTLLFIDGLELGESRRMESTLARCEQLAARIQLPHYQWRVHSLRALQAVIREAWPQAATELERARGAVARVGDPMAEATLAIQTFGLLAARGESDRSRIAGAREDIDRALKAAGSNDVFVRPLIARHLLRSGDPESAEAVCPAGVIERLFAMRELSNLQVLGDCAVLRGDRALARRVLDALAPGHPACGHAGLYGMSWNGPVALTLARICTLLDEAARARRYLVEAIAVAERSGAVPLARRLREEGPDGRPAARPAAAVVARPELVASGEFWRVRFGGQETSLKDSKGLQILARLLAEPEREFLALDLNSAAGAAVVGEDGPEALDPQARAAYRQRLRELEEALEEAREYQDAGAVEALLGEQTALQSELSRAFGLGGRKRPGGSAAERARVNVTRRLRAAIAKIGEQLPEAGRYLDSTVKTGTYCSFNPL